MDLNVIAAAQKGQHQMANMVLSFLALKEVNGWVAAERLQAAHPSTICGPDGLTYPIVGFLHERTPGVGFPPSGLSMVHGTIFACKMDR